MKKCIPFFAILIIAGLTSCRSSDSVDGFKTYVSNKYGYQIQYPKDWDVSGAGQTKIQDNHPDLLEGNFVFVIKKGVGAVMVKVWPNPRHASAKDWYNHDATEVMGEGARGVFPYPAAMVASFDETTINNSPAYKITMTDGNYDYIFTRPDYVYVLNFEVGDKNSDPAALQKIFNECLSSFRLSP